MEGLDQTMLRNLSSVRRNTGSGSIVIGVRSSDRQDKFLWYARSVLNQPRLISLSHHQPYFLVIEFFFRAARTPVDVPTVLELSGGDSGS